MPLIKSKSKEAMHENIKELVDSYKKKGMIGTSKPMNKDAAIKQAVAIAYKNRRG